MKKTDKSMKAFLLCFVRISVFDLPKTLMTKKRF